MSNMDPVRELLDHLVATLIVRDDAETKAYALLSITKAIAEARKAALEEVLAQLNRAPCPICRGIEGCAHTLPERIRALAKEGR